jgi:hypothetical protein
MWSGAMVWPLLADEQLLGVAKPVSSALLGGVAGYLGFQLQQGSRHVRLRRKLVAQLEFLKALEGVTLSRAAETRADADREVVRLLEAYTPTRDEIYRRQKNFGIAALLITLPAGIASEIFLPSQELLVGSLFGLAVGALANLSSTANNRKAYEERRKQQRSNDSQAG